MSRSTGITRYIAIAAVIAVIAVASLGASLWIARSSMNSSGSSKGGFVSSSSSSLSLSYSSAESATINSLHGYCANNASYSTTSEEAPLGAQVITVDVQVTWIIVDQVKEFSDFLLEGKVLGIVNSTYSDENFPTVYSLYVFQVNDSFIGNVHNCQKVLISQEAGVVRFSNGSYFDGNLPLYSPLTLGGNYVLALWNDTSSLGLQGPGSIFPVRNGLIFPPSSGAGYPFSTNGSTPAQFLQSWNAMHT